MNSIKLEVYVDMCMFQHKLYNTKLHTICIKTRRTFTVIWNLVVQFKNTKGLL